MIAPWKKSYDKPRQHIKKQRHYIADKGLSSQLWFFPAVMFGCKSWTIMNAEHWRTDAFQLWCWRRLFRVPWKAKRSKSVNSKGNQPWIFIGRTDAEAEAPILWLPDVKSQLTEKDPDAGKDRVGKRRRKWQRWLDNITDSTGMNLMEDSGGQSRWACCSPWGCKELETT